MFLFADDTSLLKEIDSNNIITNFNIINKDLETINKWAKLWRVKFNANKTNYMIFSNKSNRLNYPNIYFNGENICKVQYHKHLGITLSDNMTWDQHINNICCKAAKRVDSLKRLKYILPRKSLKIIYTSLIRPVIEYGSIIFDNTSAKNGLRLEAVQRSAMLGCTGAYRLTSTTNMLGELSLDTLETRRCFTRLCTMYRIANNLTPEYLTELVTHSKDMNRRQLKYMTHHIYMKTAKKYAAYDD